MNRELIGVVRQLRASDIKQDKYICSVPADINSIFFESEYFEQCHIQRTLLIRALFGDYTESVEWFLYEFEPGKTPGPHCIHADGTEFVYETDEDFYKYLEREDAV
jgi:hypothetical protein